MPLSYGAVEYFGSQSIVASIDYRCRMGKEQCYISDGSKRVDYSPLELAKKVENVRILVIVCRGARNINDMKTAFDMSGVHAVAAGSIFVYFGKQNAVLNNFPSENELIQKKYIGG